MGCTEGAAKMPVIAEEPGHARRFEIWPHQSLDRRGTTRVLGALSLGGVLVGAKPVLDGAWPVAVALVGTMLLSAVMLRLNRQALGFRQLVDVTPSKIRVAWVGLPEVTPDCEFDTAWTRVIVETDRYVENRLTLRQSDRKVEVGRFLSPDERVELAQEIRETLRAVQSTR